MENPTFPKNHSIIPKLFFDSVRFIPTPDPDTYLLEDTKLKKICEMNGVDYIDR